jgi:hypothetical protein
MPAQETAIVAKPMWAGDELYQLRAREALSVLVRQARAESNVTYGKLAAELSMPNPRNLNYVLGSVGQTLMDLGKQWGETIPPIQCLAINADNGTPGNGFGWFISDQAWKTMPTVQRRRVTEAMEKQIYAYHRWPEVLAALRLEPLHERFDDLLQKAAAMRGVGEGEDHKRLKEYVRRNPGRIGVRNGGRWGEQEKDLPSGDRTDVFFETRSEWIAVECKPASSDEADLTRGLYQCIKYAAVLRAMAAVEPQRDIHARALLVIGGMLPARVRTLQVRLGVDVIEGVTPR